MRFFHQSMDCCLIWGEKGKKRKKEGHIDRERNPLLSSKNLVDRTLSIAKLIIFVFSLASRIVRLNKSHYKTATDFKSDSHLPKKIILFDSMKAL